MFIMCQKCHTFYQVPKDLIVSQAMTFKCKKCGFTWTTQVDDDMTETPAALSEVEENNLPDDTEAIFGKPVTEKPAEPTTPTADVFAPVAEEKRPASILLPLVAWILLFLNIALFLYQEEVSSWVGKEIRTPVVIQNVSFDVLHEQDRPQLRLYAQLMNTRAQTIPAKALIVTLFDGEDNPIQQEEIVLPYEEYEPHQVVSLDRVIDPVNARTRRLEIKVKDKET